jgi:HAMP domain-containing protein
MLSTLSTRIVEKRVIGGLQAEPALAEILTATQAVESMVQQIQKLADSMQQLFSRFTL